MRVNPPDFDQIIAIFAFTVKSGIHRTQTGDTFYGEGCMSWLKLGEISSLDSVKVFPTMQTSQVHKKNSKFRKVTVLVRITSFHCISITNSKVSFEW